MADLRDRGKTLATKNNLFFVWTVPLRTAQGSLLPLKAAWMNWTTYPMHFIEA
jgi:hypothetical protein